MFHGDIRHLPTFTKDDSGITHLTLIQMYKTNSTTCGLLSTVLSSAVNNSQQHQEINSQREKFLGTPKVKPENVIIHCASTDLIDRT